MPDVVNNHEALGINIQTGNNLVTIETTYPVGYIRFTRREAGIFADELLRRAIPLGTGHTFCEPNELTVKTMKDDDIVLQFERVLSYISITRHAAIMIANEMFESLQRLDTGSGLILPGTASFRVPGSQGNA